jgi:hypothetical protein
VSDRAVWKFEIPIQDRFELQMPAGAEIVHVEVQAGNACLWALVEPERGAELRVFYLRGTGRRVEPGLRHLGSFLLHRGEFVGHLFEEAR